MDIFFADPDTVPLPPDEIKINNLSAHPWADQQRVRVELEITPFQKKPNAVISVNNQAGEEVSSITIIETIEYNMEFTLHLRDCNKPGRYIVTALIYYETYAEEIEQLYGQGSGTNKNIVDTAQVDFLIL
jgi:hypothetical protein